MGKASLIYVVGLSVMLGYALLNVSWTSTQSMDNYMSYYGRSMAHNLALTGANIACQRLLQDPSYSTDLTDQQYAGGIFNVYIDKSSGDSCLVKSYAEINLTGAEMRDTVIACLKFTPLAKYGWFTDSERNGYHGSPWFGDNDWKITGDSIFGPAHTNYKFNLGGAPYFNDKVTATNAPTTMPLKGVQAPIFKAGYQWGITVPRPSTNLDAIVSSAGSDGKLFTGQDVSLNFLDDRVAVKIPPGTGSVRNDTVSIASLTHNGIIAVMNGDLRVKGEYSGKVTVAAHNDGSATTKGNIWLDGTGIVAKNNPLGNTSSPDMMGIISNNNVVITKDLSRTTSTVYKVQGAVYCQNGELTAEDFWEIPLSGRVEVVGGVNQHTAGTMGAYNPGHGLWYGFYYTVRYDTRLSSMSPPGYPVAYKYELVSWWEN